MSGTIPSPLRSKEDDSLALEEEKRLKKDRDLEKEEAEQDFDLKQSAKTVLVGTIILLIFILGLALAAGIIVWVAHILIPQDYRWLLPEEIDRLQQLMTSALLGMLVSAYGRRLLN